MKIILKEDVHGLGYKDEILTVKDGYGRNFLIPTGKAILATPSAEKVLAEELKQRAHKLAKIKADAEALAAKLNEANITIATKASEAGKVFGSVTSMQIAEELEKQGISIDKRTIVLKEALKELGTVKVAVKPTLISVEPATISIPVPFTGSETVNSYVAEISGFSINVAVIVTLPNATPVTRPFSSTVAIASSLDVQVASV